jgi:hypothetical protein
MARVVFDGSPSPSPLPRGERGSAEPAEKASLLPSREKDRMRGLQSSLRRQSRRPCLYCVLKRGFIASVKASSVGAPLKTLPLMKNVGVPFTPSFSPRSRTARIFF